ncbi:MAG: hypothetical protein HN424_03460 [Candidatus Jacksonbacteria bacterium]|nr:hypothetical protein [Candidatus Jacksonbacteria bacterium]MBT6034154.1 hypothetical protein [Candidatus Jacksonbacteria bacterium]
MAQNNSIGKNPISSKVPKSRINKFAIISLVSSFSVVFFAALIVTELFGLEEYALKLIIAGLATLALIIALVAFSQTKKNPQKKEQIFGKTEFGILMLMIFFVPLVFVQFLIVLNLSESSLVMFVFSLILLALGFLFGFVALFQIKKNPLQKGKVSSIIGMLIPILLVLFLFVVPLFVPKTPVAHFPMGDELNPTLPYPLDSSLKEWKNYTNETLGFTIKYPMDWEYLEFDNAVNFGTPESRSGGYIFGVSVHAPEEMEEIIAKAGIQWDDRKETRTEHWSSEGLTGTVVTVTTKKVEGWISKKVYKENDGRLFVIGNGAREDERFFDFYNSIQFTK